MIVFLLWQRFPEEPRPKDVAARLQAFFAPVLPTPPEVRILTSAATSLISLELPVNGWKPSPFQQDEQLWALAPDYPVGAESALAAEGIRVSGESVLPVLCQALEERLHAGYDLTRIQSRFARIVALIAASERRPSSSSASSESRAL